MSTTATPPVAKRTLPGRGLVWLGILTILAGVAGYAVQLFYFKILEMPWYTLALAVVGVVLLGVAVYRAPTLWRVIGLVFWTLFAAFEVWFLVFFSKLPSS